MVFAEMETNPIKANLSEEYCHKNACGGDENGRGQDLDDDFGQGRFEVDG